MNVPLYHMTRWAIICHPILHVLVAAIGLNSVWSSDFLSYKQTTLLIYNVSKFTLDVTPHCKYTQTHPGRTDLYNPG